MDVFAPPDVEALIVPLLQAFILSRSRPEPVGVQVPAAWTTSSPPFVQVVSDGTPVVDYPIRCLSTVRVVAWSKDPGVAKSLASLCMGFLLGYGGDDVITRVSDGIGPLVAVDNATRARIASVTVTVSTRLSRL